LLNKLSEKLNPDWTKLSFVSVNHKTHGGDLIHVRFLNVLDPWPLHGAVGTTVSLISMAAVL